MRNGAKNQALITGRIAYGSDGTDVYAIAVDANGALAQAQTPTTVGDGRAVVAATATANTIGAAATTKVIIVTAELDNGSAVTVGGATVVGANATRRGTPLYAGDSVTLYTDNLTNVWIDALVNGEGVTYTYMV